MLALLYTHTNTSRHSCKHIADTHTHPHTQPLFVSVTNYTDYAKLMFDVLQGVPALPPVVHAGPRMDKKGMRVENTYIWSHVEDASQRKNRMHKYVNPRDYEKPFMKDTFKVLKDMSALVTGTPIGNAFVSKNINYNDPGIALAALVVAIYSSPGSTIWDLCKERPLMALPMAAV